MIRRLKSIPIQEAGENVPLAADVFEEDGRCYFIANCSIDADGSGGNPYNDPYFQPDTAYRYKGDALNPYKVPFIVLPSSLIQAVIPVVLGCRARMTNLKNGRSAEGIVGDVGPSKKLGECSCAMAEMVGMSGHPNHGGISDYNGVLYEWWPGEQTTINGITYPLQPS